MHGQVEKCQATIEELKKINETLRTVQVSSDLANVVQRTLEANIATPR